MNAVGDRIRSALGRKGWTISRLARELGISQPNVSAIIAGRWPGRCHYTRLASLLGVPIEWLTTGHPPQPWEDDDAVAARAAAAPEPEQPRDRAQTTTAVQALADALAAMRQDWAAMRVERDRLSEQCRETAAALAECERRCAALQEQLDALRRTRAKRKQRRG